MDVWMLGCIIFLFGALAELAVVSYIIRNDRPNSPPKVVRCKADREMDEPPSSSANKLLNELDDYRGTARDIGARVPYASINGHLHPMVVYDERYINAAYRADRVCLITFPIMFCTFNIFYWFTYVV